MLEVVEGQRKMGILKGEGVPLVADDMSEAEVQGIPWIPKGWTLRKLADFGVFRSGSVFPIIHQGLQSGDYPFFKVSDMNNQGNELFMKVANHWINEETRKELKAVKHPTGSIVFAKIGAAIHLERKRLLSQESCIDNNMMAFSLTGTYLKIS